MQLHLHLRTLVPALIALTALAACGDDLEGSPRRDASMTEAGPPPAAIDASSEAAGPTGGLAVVNGDYSSSTLSLLDREGNLRLDGCLTSGSKGAGMTATLSGDVVLPTQVPTGGPLALVDRSNAAITWLDPATCGVLGQLAVGTGFRANPQDVVTLSAHKAYVVRQDPNPQPTPTPDDFDEGNDLLVVDPARPAIVGRIDLAPYAPTGVLPRAHRALLAGGRVFVSLNAIDVNYEVYGEGRVLIVDPATDQVTGFVDIPGAKNCGALTYLAASQRLLVACGGAYGAPGPQLATSAIAAIDLAQSPPVVVAQVGAASVGTVPFSNLALAALDATTAIAVGVGDLSGTPPDSLWAVPLDGRAPVGIFTSSEGFALGGVLYDEALHRVFAADGTMAGNAYLRPFDVAGGVFTAGKPIKTNPAQKLPPRSLAFY